MMPSKIKSAETMQILINIAAQRAAASRIEDERRARRPLGPRANPRVRCDLCARDIPKRKYEPGPIAHRCHHGFGFHCSEKLDGEGNALVPRTPECPHCAEDRA